MTQELIAEIEKFLEGVNATNFSAKYEELAVIIISFNKIGLRKEALIKILNEYYNAKAHALNTYQDEVLVEIISCIEGFSSLNKIINLDS